MATFFLYVSATLYQSEPDADEGLRRFSMWSWTVRPENFGGAIPGVGPHPEPDPNPEPEPDPDPGPLPTPAPNPGPDPGFPIDPYPRPVPVRVTTVFQCEFKREV